VVLDLFKKQISVKKGEVKEACMDKLKEEIMQSTYVKILRELSYCKGNQWIFKSGNGTDA
jgi:hypothetical protein